MRHDHRVRHRGVKRHEADLSEGFLTWGTSDGLSISGTAPSSGHALKVTARGSSMSVAITLDFAPSERTGTTPAARVEGDERAPTPLR
jgi:hypothetical protein